MPLIGALPVLDEILQAADQIHAALADGVPQHLGIGEQEIRRRDHVEHLARHELDDVLVLLGDAAHAGRRVVPPLLLEQERLVDEVVRPLLPLLAGEAPILRQRLDAAAASCRPPARSGRHSWRTGPLFLAGLVDELQPLAGRIGEMRRPIEIGFGQRRRRQPGVKRAMAACSERSVMSASAVTA